MSAAAAALARSGTLVVGTVEGAFDVEVRAVVGDVPFDDGQDGLALVVPLDALHALGPAYADSETILVRLADGADAAETAAAAEDLLGPQVRTTVRSEELAAMRGAPFSELLRQAFVLTAAVTAAYAVLAVLLWLVVTAAARTAFLSILRTLGTTSRQTARLVLVELLPTVVVAVLAGAATGWALTWLAAPAVDVTGLTRGAAAPLRGEPATMLVLAAATAAVVVLAVLASLAYLRRRRPTDVLRLGGER